MKRVSTSSGRFRVIGKRTALWLCVAAILLVALVTMGLGKAAETMAAPVRRPIYSVEISEKKVSLGINCAWDNADIPQLLKVLERYNVRATFFAVGDWCDQYPESVKAIAEAGHEIGSHSDTHADLTKLDQEGIRREIRVSAEKIRVLTGTMPTLFRSPSGAYDNQVIQLIEEAGMYPVQWDCDSLDYRGLTAQEMENRILRKLRCGSILLFHSGAENTASALPQIIDAIRAQGYEFIPISLLIHPRPYTVDFEGRQHPYSG